MDLRRKFLLTGGTGILGTELQKEQDLFALNYWAPLSRELDICSDLTESWFAENYEKLQKINGIVHCAAFTNVPLAEAIDVRGEAVGLNILGSKNIKDLAHMLGVPVIYISTDYVYPGDTGNYSEDDMVRPVNYYAMTKLAGEAFMDLETDVIIRTSFKPNKPWPYEKAFGDLYTSADYVDIIASKINFIISQIPDFAGIYNVGTERKSIYDLARRRNTKVKPMSRREITSVNLPSDVSMDTTKFDKAYDYITGDW